MVEYALGQKCESYTHLDTFDVSSSPERFENQIGETQNSEIFDELLSQVMIDPAMERRYFFTQHGMNQREKKKKNNP